MRAVRFGRSPRFFVGHVALVALACSACTGASETPVTDVKIAWPEDFRGYHSWESFDVTSGATDAGIHDGSNVTEYLSARPPHGSTEFPVGTKIVKEAMGGTGTHPIFAMEKRGKGGGYNKEGVPGWEWFELKNVDDGKDGVTFQWRGRNPPAAGDLYGGSPNGGCNPCHADCNNDAVCAKQLRLSLF